MEVGACRGPGVIGGGRAWRTGRKRGNLPLLTSTVSAWRNLGGLLGEHGSCPTSDRQELDTPRTPGGIIGIYAARPIRWGPPREKAHAQMQRRHISSDMPILPGGWMYPLAPLAGG